MDNLPENFKCPVCHKIMEVNEELEEKANRKFIEQYGLERFEELRAEGSLVRICNNCNKMLNAYLN